MEELLDYKTISKIKTRIKSSQFILFHAIKNTLKAIINVTLIINLSNHKNQPHRNVQNLLARNLFSGDFSAIKSLSSPRQQHQLCEWDRMSQQKSFKFRSVCKEFSRRPTSWGLHKTFSTSSAKHFNANFLWRSSKIIF